MGLELKLSISSLDVLGSDWGRKLQLRNQSGTLRVLWLCLLRFVNTGVMLCHVRDFLLNQSFFDKIDILVAKTIEVTTKLSFHIRIRISIRFDN